MYNLSLVICKMAAMEEMLERNRNALTLIVIITDKQNSPLKFCFKVTNVMKIVEKYLLIIKSSKSMMAKIVCATKSTDMPFLIVL